MNCEDAIRLESALTCPRCGAVSRLTMADDSCLIAYDCPSCGAHLSPKHGDCCVFCSFGDVPCPPVQRERSARCATPMDGAAK